MKAQPVTVLTVLLAVVVACYRVLIKRIRPVEVVL